MLLIQRLPPELPQNYRRCVDFDPKLPPENDDISPKRASDNEAIKPSIK